MRSVASPARAASIEVAPDGQTLTADFTIQFTGEGAPEGEFGPGTVTGTRVSVEPMGTPAGSLEDLEGSFAEGTEVTAGTEMAAPPTTPPPREMQRTLLPMLLLPAPATTASSE